MPTFTREQHIAQSADRHLAVTAGAGAGKTSVLVQRFAHLLFDPSIYADVRSITAITFTRKAAAEMHHRVSQEIEKRLADPERKPQWGKIKAVRERFSSANISTIHSFCARLLREFPIEAGVNPNFTELEEHEGVLMKEHAIMDTLESWLEEKEESKGKKGKKIESSQETEPSAKQLAARRV
ncbi:MAG: UvrD-helicase domain-containing protein, partial [Gloeotrichia echinulata HAB0833]